MTTLDSKEYFDFLLKLYTEQLGLAKHNEQMASSTGTSIIGLITVLAFLKGQTILDSFHGLPRVEILLVLKAALVLVAISRVTYSLRASLYRSRADVYCGIAAAVTAVRSSTPSLIKPDFENDLKAAKGLKGYVLRAVFADYGFHVSSLFLTLVLLVSVLIW